MKSLVDEIITGLQRETFSVTIKSIRSAYSKLAPEYPMIAVSEIENSNRTSILGKERFSDLGYQIDIFSKDIYPTAGADICSDIGSVVDNYLQSTYGFTRVTTIRLPDISDSTVSRLSLRYTGILDVVNDITYR